MGSYSFTKVRWWMAAILIFSTCLGDVAGINFVSMEHYRGPDRGFEITLTDLIAFSLLVSAFMRFPSKIKWFPLNTVLFMVLFGSALISSAVAPEPLFSAFTLFKMLRSYMLYLCVANIYRMGIPRDYIWGGYILIGVVVTVLALQQKYLWGIYRIYGPFDHSNTVPIYLNLIMPVVLLWGFCDSRMSMQRMLISVLTAMGMVFCVVATVSRAGIAFSGLCMAGVFCILLMYARSLRFWVASVLIAIVVIFGALKSYDTVMARFENAPAESEMARAEFERVAKMMTREHTFGVGLNNFSLVMTSTSRYRKNVVVMAGEEESGVVHNVYLLTSSEMGYLGLIVYILVITRFLALYAWAFLRERKSMDGLLLGAYCLGFIAAHLTGFLEWAMRITPVTYLFVITSGIAAALREDLIFKRKYAMLPSTAG
ncbi:MAG: O-antigen ligase family protein [Candidatus Omnitrophica bacterium]|nr:O-antigen ligase family protein [Candidatus Omnitrophota bacterium]